MQPRPDGACVEIQQSRKNESTMPLHRLGLMNVVPTTVLGSAPGSHLPTNRVKSPIFFSFLFQRSIPVAICLFHSRSTAGLLVAGSTSSYVLSFSSVSVATVSQEEEGIQFSRLDLKSKSHEFLFAEKNEAQTILLVSATLANTSIPFFSIANKFRFHE
jgi:hypothetical protein